ncbi:MAG: uracil-DNA glycosylase [Thermoguttaceae bacterium]|nr:uracil-DNA glycosylase [Thermoguttaceae bacterium]
MARIECKVAVCTRCPELARTRKKTVFGVGNPHARLVFMGEAPGADEDLQGEPFVGKAGQKLTEIIEKGMRLRRQDVYILNTIKCRPPGNRVPTPEEAANCREYLDAQLAILQPEFICCLGATAAQNLLGVTSPIGQLRGRFYDYRGIKVICTYHPSYVLRSPEVARPAVWADIQMLMREMGLSIPKK